jgi:hypothetical protein
MKLKEFETPFDTPPPLMELLVLPDEALPVLCVGVTRDKATRKKYLAIVNPNHPPDKMAQHMDKVGQMSSCFFIAHFGILHPLSPSNHNHKQRYTANAM